MKERFIVPISFLTAGLVLVLLLGSAPPLGSEIPYSSFRQDLSDGKIADVAIGSDTITGTYRDGVAFTTRRVGDPTLLERLDAKKVTYAARPDS